MASKPSMPGDQPDFSLVLGGPLFQLFRRAHLSGDGLELLRRRILVISGVAWLPLLFLSVFSERALDTAAGIPFLYDIEAHVRFLIALPLLIAAELLVHRRVRGTVRQFVKRRIIVAEEMERFRQIIESTLRLRNSVIGEAVLLAAVYTVGLWVWRSQIALDTATWYAIPGDGRANPTPAGYWYLLVSLPIFQFILLRWYLRMLLWFVFLWRVSRLNLHIIPIHPDQTGGLGFLGRSTNAFMPLVLAQGAVVAGLIANQIFYAGQELMSFKMEIAVFVAFLVAVMLAPLTVFWPQLAHAKRQGLNEYGVLGSRYVQEFDAKWLRGGAGADESLLGSGDIQSLADLRGGYSIVQDMRQVPFTLKDAIRLAAAAVVPLLPLTLTIFSLEELAGYLVKILF